MSLLAIILVFVAWGIVETLIAKANHWPWFADWTIFFAGCIILSVALQ